jgi:hypothetical protein
LRKFAVAVTDRIHYQAQIDRRLVPIRNVEIIVGIGGRA